MSQESELYNLQLPDEPSESCLSARATFLDYVLRLRPKAIADLWDKALPEFKSSVVQRFHEKIFEGIDNPEEYLDAKQRECLETPNSSFFHLLHRKLEAATGAPPYSSFDNLSQRPELAEKVKSVIQEYVKAFRESLLVKLMQNKLEPALGASDPIRMEFFCFATISERQEYNVLTATIQKWSETWNLNAEWCRDHALSVLREWLLNRYLSSVGLDSFRQSVQQSGWTSGAHELLYQSVFTRVMVDHAVHGTHGPEPLNFKWLGYDVVRPGYNRLKESQKNYKRRLLAEFELYLIEKRRAVLLELLNAQNSGKPTNGRIESYSQMLKTFRKALNEHVKVTIKATEKSVSNLVKAKKKRKLADHVRWTVEYHVPPTKTLDEIVEFEDCIFAIADGLRELNPRESTRKEIGELPGLEMQNADDIDRAIGFLVERRILHTKHEDSTHRVIESLKSMGRTDLLGPFKSAADENKAFPIFHQLVEADYERTGGQVIVRYSCANPDKKRQPNVPDRTTVNKEVNLAFDWP